MKIKDIIVGQFYKLMVEPNTYLLKIDKVVDDLIYINNYYIFNNSYYENHYYDNHFDTSDWEYYVIEKIEICDIIKFLPVNHPDKKIYLRKQKIKHILCN